jgi:hypothetical protein
MYSRMEGAFPQALRSLSLVSSQHAFPGVSIYPVTFNFRSRGPSHFPFSEQNIDLLRRPFHELAFTPAAYPAEQRIIGDPRVTLMKSPTCKRRGLSHR